MKVTFLLVLIYFLILIGLVYVCNEIERVDESVVVGYYEYKSLKDIKTLMKKHGILYVMLVDGEWVFFRNGKKIRL